MISQILGTALALVVLAVYVLALYAIWRVPFRALGVLVAGMAFHNFVIMALLNLGTPSIFVRVVQSWKEGILLLLFILGAYMAFGAWRSGAWRSKRMPRLLPLDLVAIAFLALACIYLVLPRSILPGESNLAQRLVSFRVTLLLPLLYGFGRIFWSTKRQDILWVARAILGAAGIVGIFGLWELWFVPTPLWVDWGANLWSAWLGFHYLGPGGLPENFFHSTAEGFGLRRMVSTYISPLGLAYTGLMVLPVAIAFIMERSKEKQVPGWFRWGAFVLLVIGILFSVTRGALVSMLGEFALLCLIFRRWLMVALSAAAVVCVGFILVDYINLGPLVTSDLREVRLPAGYALVQSVERSVAIAVGQTPPSVTKTVSNTNATGATSSGELLQRTLSTEDPSAGGHVAALQYGLQYAVQHPMGTGLGSGVLRFGGSIGGLNESAILTVFGEMGIMAGVLYLILYGAGIYYGFRAFWRLKGTSAAAVFPLACFVGGLALLPITLTSAVWGDFSLTFLFWWCVGLSTTLFYLPTEEEMEHRVVALPGKQTPTPPGATQAL